MTEQHECGRSDCTNAACRTEQRSELLAQIERHADSLAKAEKESAKATGPRLEWLGRYIAEYRGHVDVFNARLAELGEA